ncbi:Glycosyl transferase, family 17 [uncultured Caudovirales phage]|uniref:Glycosyl transferase, family 17 n=1 Tax=uncultured Caudovirales phage TaxID=2100421 RepID=A0A6J5KPN9_9CAUD|nr:Glycosyl transferase, family 17 [uncultured Caudovirales phage]
MKVIDCFPFFNEKELLELRVHLLNPIVDEFIICESNRTHSGNLKEFTCKKLIEELNLPKDKIHVIELDLSDDSLVIPNNIDAVNSRESNSSKEIKAWSRERLQRDAILEYIKYYSDDTVFVISDCDEIINPDDLPYFAQVSLSQNLIIKVSLVLLEGNANQRMYNKGMPVNWDKSLFVCTKKHLNEVTPTMIRSNVDNKFGSVQLTQDGKPIEECGWHFTWMGDEERRKAKAESFIHYANMNAINTLSSNSMERIANNSNSYILKRYPNSSLPKKIFELERVKKFLIGETNFTKLV